MAILTCRPRNRLSKERLRVFRHQQAQKARQARRVLDRNHQQLPKQAGSFRPPCTGLHTSDLSSFRPPRRRRDIDPWRTYHLQPAPLPGRLGSRTPLQLSPRLLAQSLELLASAQEIQRLLADPHQCTDSSFATICRESRPG